MALEGININDRAAGMTNNQSVGLHGDYSRALDIKMKSFDVVDGRVSVNRT